MRAVRDRCARAENTGESGRNGLGCRCHRVGLHPIKNTCEATVARPQAGFEATVRRALRGGEEQGFRVLRRQ